MVVVKDNGIKTFLSRLARFVGLLVVAWFVLMFAVSNLGDAVQEPFRRFTNLAVGHWPTGGFSRQRFAEMEQHENVDVLFAGSSHCYRTFDPRFYRDRGLAVFNMGSTAQTPLNAYYLLEGRIDRLKPKLVVMEVFWAVLGADGTESFLDLLTNAPLDGNLVRMGIATGSLRSATALLSRWMRIGELESGPVTGTGHYVAGGFAERREGFVGDLEGRPTVADIEREQLEYLRRIIDMVEAGGGRVLLAVQPLPESTVSRTRGLAEARQELVLFARDNRVPLFDYVARGALVESRYYFDFHHLNRIGVEKFNQMFFEDVEARGLWPRRP